MDSQARIDIRDTFGSAYVGELVMMILYGITCLQSYMYFMRYPNDSLSTKLLVLILWVLDTVHISCVSHAMYYYLVDNYANPLGLNNGVWSLYVSIAINVWISFLVQSFFVHKLHELSNRNWWLTGVISIITFAHLAFGMETVGELFKHEHLSEIADITFIAAMPLAVAAVLSDILITVSLCTLLHGRRTAFRSTNRLLESLIIYAINRCLITSTLAIVEVIIFATRPQSFWFLAVDFVIGKCYANSLLATLNTRASLRGRGSDTEEAYFDGDSSGEGMHSSLRIAAVTSSMLSRSRVRTQTSERVSLHFDGGPSKSDESCPGESKELKTLNLSQQDRTHVSITPADQDRTVNHRHTASDQTGGSDNHAV